MKKIFKRLISIVLVVVLILTSITSLGIVASASTIPSNVSVETASKRIYELYDKLGAGSYFTTTHSNDCGSKSRGHSCSNCKLSTILSKTWFKNKFGDLSTSQFPKTYYLNGGAHGPDGWSCFGFASFAEWYIYHNKQTDTVKTKYIGTYSYDYSGVSKNIRTGDLIRLGDGHSAIVISYDSTGVKVLDSNWNGNYNCAVYIHTIKYTSYSQYSISRAENSVLQTTTSVTPSISVNKSNLSLGLFNNTSSTISVTCNGNYSTLNYTSNTEQCNVTNDTWNGNVCTFTVVSKAVGSTVLNFNLLDDSDNTIASAKTAVTVVGSSLSISPSSVSLNLNQGNTASLSVVASGDLPSYHINVNSANGKVSLSQSGEWSNNSDTVTVTGKTVGSDTITFDLVNNDNGKIILSKTVNVTISANNYTINYNANGGTNAPTNQTKTYGQDLTLSTATPTGKTYTVTFNGNGGTVSTSSKSYTQSFTGWNTKADGTGTNYTSGGIYSSNASATLYAIWRDPTLSVANPTRSNYYFLGWYDSNELDSYGKPAGRLYSSSSKITGNITLYAMWSQSVDLLVFFGDYNLDGQIDFIYDVTGFNNIRLGSISYTDGDIFRGDVDADGDLDFDDITMINQARTGQINQYTMPCYYGVSGSVKEPPIKTTYQYGESLDTTGLVLQAKFYSGATHLIGSELVVTGYDPYKIGEQTLTVSYYVVSAQFTVYVEAPKYSVYYDANGGYESSGGKTVTYGQSVGALAIPERDGYTFLGWTYDANSSNYITADTVYTYQSNKTLYAQWSLNTYTVSYSANGGNNAPSSRIVTHGNAITVATDTLPIRTGHTFLGYSTLNSATVPAYVPGDTFVVTQSQTLYAVWQEASSIDLDSINNGMITFAGQENIFEFTPEESGYYRVYSTRDMILNFIFTSNNNGLSGSYQSDEDVPIYVGLNSGQTYYLRVSAVNTNDIGVYTIGIEKKLNEYDITLMDSLSDEPMLIIAFEGEEVILPELEHDGYTFLGWSSSNLVTSVSYLAGETMTIDSDVMLYAVWELNTLLGDINGDGIVDAADAGLISRYDAGFITLTSDQLKVGDVNGDGVVDAADAGLISRYDAGFISSFG